jgi:hypothetical protein
MDKSIKKIFKTTYSFIEKNSKHLLKSTSNSLLDLTGKKFDEKIEDVVSKDGILRIGIVGQVKAGKSSFINALLFDGKDILPKASTPMTASLTVIKYSKKISAEVEFYSEADWGIIERKAKEFIEVYRQVEIEFKQDKKLFPRIIRKEDIENETKLRVGESISSSYEVYIMAKDSNLNIKSYIGKRKKISENISSINELVGKLQDYVGVNGKFTPITRNTNLYLDIPTLKGIELIDTPGTNDPIVSRGQTTRDFLSRCDTVFLLSYSGQFMGKEDAEFLVNTLPSEGISDIMLLGSKFDSALVDEFKKYNGDIRRALKDLSTKLSAQANDSLEKIIASNPNKPIMQKIKNKKVKFISGICYNIAKKDKKNLDEMEAHALKNLEKRYKLKFSNEILFDLANIDVIRDKDLEHIKKDKNKILANKLNDFLLGQKTEVIKRLNELESNLNERLKELENSKIEELINGAKTLEKGFDRAKEGIEQTFVDFKFDIKEKLYKLIREIDSQRGIYIGISRSRDSREVYSHTTGMLWWKKTHYTTKYYDIANVNEAVDKAVKFIREANEAISHSWNNMINLQDIEINLIKQATKGFDLSDTSFNKNKIINPVKNALREIKIKPYRLKDREYINQITSAFSRDRVEGSDINRLERILSEVLYKITEDIEKTIEFKIDKISTLLDEKSETFVANIKNDSNETLSKLKDDLANREASIARDLKLIKNINQLKSELLK